MRQAFYKNERLTDEERKMTEDNYGLYLDYLKKNHMNVMPADEEELI